MALHPGAEIVEVAPEAVRAGRAVPAPGSGLSMLEATVMVLHPGAVVTEGAPEAVRADRAVLDPRLGAFHA